MSRDLGCRDLLQAGLASPHPSPLEGSSVAADGYTPSTVLPLGSEGASTQEHSDHGAGDACAATRHRKPILTEDPRSQPEVQTTVMYWRLDVERTW